MNRRAFLGVAFAAGVAGCIGRTHDRDDARNDTTGRSSSDRNPDSPTTTSVTSAVPTTATAPPTFTPQSDRETETRAENAEGPPQPALVIHHSGPADADAVRIKVAITTSEGDTVFERVGTLESGESVSFDDLIEEPGSYRIEVRLDDGTTATKEIGVLDGGIQSYTSYTVRISFGEIEIRRLEV